MININKTYHSLHYPSLPKISIDRLENMLRKTTSIAIPIIALYAASNAKLADGIGFTYDVCIVICSMLLNNNVEDFLQCVATCMPTLLLP